MHFLRIWWDGSPCSSYWEERKPFFTVVFLDLAFLVCAASYILIACLARSRSPGSVSQRNLRRASYYPLNFLISWGGIILTHQDPRYTDKWCPGCLTPAVAVLCTSGLLNAVVYGCQTGHRYTSGARAVPASITSSGGDGSISGSSQQHLACVEEPQDGSLSPTRRCQHHRGRGLRDCGPEQSVAFGAVEIREFP